MPSQLTVPALVAPPPASQQDDEQSVARRSQDNPLAAFDSILDISVDIRLKVAEGGPLPPDPSEKLFASVPIPAARRANWIPREFRWAASECWHHPLYFDDVQLERYGQMRHRLVQPFLSGVHFFGNVPILPYKMGLDRPCDLVATLGYYRPGSVTPEVGRWLPLEADASMFEGLAWAALIFALP